MIRGMKYAMVAALYVHRVCIYITIECVQVAERGGKGIEMNEAGAGAEAGVGMGMEMGMVMGEENLARLAVEKLIKFVFAFVTSGFF